MVSGPVAARAGVIVALHPPPHPRDPRRLVGWVPGAPNRVVLDRARALVLAEVVSGRTAWDPRSAAPTAAAWDEAAASLIRAGLCAAGDGGARFAPDAAEITHIGEGAAPNPAPLPGRLQVLWNFAMRPGPEGFLAFSARRRKYALLPPEAVAVLRLFVNPAEPELALAGEATEAHAFLPWLFDLGLLVDAQDAHGERVMPTRLADVRSACDAQRAQTADEIARLPAALAEALPTTLAERTPVYCVCVTTDLEARSQIPLALGMILANAQRHDGGALLDAYHFVPGILRTPAAVRDAVKQHGPGIVLFSDYIWTVDVHLRISRALKEACPEIVTVHGGSSVPAYEAEAARFLAEHPHVDVTVRGEGEATATEILATLAPFRGRPAAGLHRLRDVAGLTFRDPSSPDGVTRTPERPRAVDVDAFPSPYLTGMFDDVRPGDVVAAILETNRGCPYGCTYCDWGLGTLQKIRSFDLERVRGEIEWIAARRIPIVWCADANFGILDRDVEIARMVADARRRHGFPRQFLVNYAKNATRRIAEIVGILRDADVAAEAILAMQTTDPTTLGIVRRANIKTKRYDELMDVFRALKLPVATDILLGLPGSTVDSFAADLQHCIERRIPAKAYMTRVLVNSPMADPAYREKYRIETDANDDIVATFSFTREDLRTMQRLYEAYRLHETSGVLFYVLRYLQHDHGIQAVAFLRRLVEVVASNPGAYPVIAWVDRYAPYNLNAGGWRPFYEEIGRYLGEQHGIAMSPALATVLRVQEAVIREPGRVLPETVPLAHDFVAWWHDHVAGVVPAPTAAPLDTYPPGQLVVSDPDELCRVDLMRQRQYGSHFIRWELASPLRTADAVPFFIDVDDPAISPVAAAG